MPAISSLDALKTHLSISDTSEDTLLTQLLNEVEATAIRKTRRGSFGSAEVTEYHDGAESELLCLRRFPVTAIGGLWVDGAGYYGSGTDPFPDSAEWVEGRDFALRRTDESEENRGLVVCLAGGYWPCGRGNIKVTYTAGYTTVPPDLVLAINLLAAAVRAGAEKGLLLAGETIGKYTWRLLEGRAPGGLELITAGSILAGYEDQGL